MERHYILGMIIATYIILLNVFQYIKKKQTIKATEAAKFVYSNLHHPNSRTNLTLVFNRLLNLNSYQFKKAVKIYKKEYGLHLLNDLRLNYPYDDYLLIQEIFNREIKELENE